MDKLSHLLKVMQRLRDLENGCPWDIQQTFSSIVPYTIEEVYEVADAIDQQDFTQLKDELGDLLLQIVYYAQMANEQNLFDLEDVAANICDKLIRRHPHVFDIENYQGHDHDQSWIKKDWEKIKRQERDEKAGLSSNSLLNDIPAAMPQLIRAKKIQKRVASVGFDWQEVSAVIKKVEEELAEINEVIISNKKQEALEEELGDLLFSVVNLSRHLEVNAEEALRKGNNKFIQRFQYLEARVEGDGKKIEDCSLDELEKYWQLAKQKEVLI
jgi:ATP diphosphatase